MKVLMLEKDGILMSKHINPKNYDKYKERIIDE